MSVSQGDSQKVSLLSDVDRFSEDKNRESSENNQTDTVIAAAAKQKESEEDQLQNGDSSSSNKDTRTPTSPTRANRLRESQSRRLRESQTRQGERSEGEGVDGESDGEERRPGLELDREALSQQREVILYDPPSPAQISFLHRKWRVFDEK